MASDASDSLSSLIKTATSSTTLDTPDQLASTAATSGSQAFARGLPRKCYSMVELMDLATKPLSKVCPPLLDMENATNKPWLLSIIPGPHLDGRLQPSSGDLRPTGTAEERARALRTQDSELGITFKPQRLSFTDGCRTSSVLSPQKSVKSSSVLLTNKENVSRDSNFEAFGDRNRDRPGQDNGAGGVARGGNREFVSTRMQSNNNPRYGTYNTDRDRYNNNGSRSYNNDRGGLQRNLSRDQQQHDDRNYDRGYGNNRGNRDYERGDDMQRPYHHGTGDHEQDEPEWMNDGPTSQTEFIELRGFDDDLSEDDKEKGKKGGADKDAVVSNGFTVDKKSGQLIRETMKEQPPKTETDSKSEKAGEHVNGDGSGKTSAAAEKTGPAPDNENSFVDRADTSVNSGYGRSRFMDLFSNPVAGAAAATRKESERPADSPPTPTSVPASQAVAPQPFSRQEAGRNLLQMLQKNDAPSAGAPTAKPPMFKTLEDIEGEQMQQSNQIQQQASLQQQQQRALLMHQSREGAMWGRPLSGGIEQLGSPQHRPSSPVLSANHGRFFPAGVVDQSPPVPLLHIPDDPSLHKLLNLPTAELVNMRDTGHFDHNTLMTLIQMKHQKAAAQTTAFAASGALHRLPGQYAIPISVPISGPAHMHGLPLPQHQFAPLPGMVRMPNGQMMGQQMRFAHPPNLMHAHQEALMRQLSGSRSPIPQQFAHDMAMLRMSSPQYNHMSIEDLTRLEANRMAASRQGPASPTGQRPSPLLPTAVMRKTVQRGDSMTKMLPSCLQQSANSPQLLDQLQGRQNGMQQQQPLQQQQPQPQRSLEDEYRQLMLAQSQQNEENHHRNMMAHRQMQGQFPYPGQMQMAGHFPGQQHQPDFPGQAHNGLQPDF